MTQVVTVGEREFTITGPNELRYSPYDDLDTLFVQSLREGDALVSLAAEGDDLRVVTSVAEWLLRRAGGPESEWRMDLLSFTPDALQPGEVFTISGSYIENPDPSRPHFVPEDTP